MPSRCDKALYKNCIYLLLFATSLVKNASMHVEESVKKKLKSIMKEKSFDTDLCSMTCDLSTGMPVLVRSENEKLERTTCERVAAALSPIPPTVNYM